MRHPALAAIVVSLLATGCPKAVPDTRPDIPERPDEGALITEVRRLSAQAEALQRLQDEAVWKTWTEGAPLDLAASYGGREALFSRASIDAVRILLGPARNAAVRGDDGERALVHLHTHLVGEHLAQLTAEPSEAAANLEASLTFPLDGKELPLRDLDRLLAAERSSEQRRRLYSAATPAVERLTVALKRRDEQLLKAIAGLGYRNYQGLGEELRGADLEAMGKLAETILSATDGPWSEVLDRLSRRELSMPRAEVRLADLPRLFRVQAVDELFPKDQQLAKLTGTLAGMGLSFESLPQLHVDLKDSPQKQPRPLSVAPSVPTDVRLSLKPVGGVRAMAALFHEAGHALHFALSQPVSPSRPNGYPPSTFELARLGNPTVGDAYGFVFEDLIEDPVWLAEAGLQGTTLQNYLAGISAYKLQKLREKAGLLIYELRARAVHGVEEEQLFHEVMSRAYGLELSPEEDARYLVSREELYAPADELRAWLLAGQIQGQLKGRFGPSWWKQKDAGGYLKTLFARGNALAPDEVAKLAGDRAVRPDVLLLRLGAALGVAIRLHTQEP